MTDFESLYREFASLAHYPVDQFKVFKSTFPILLSVASKHLKQIPTDTPFWKSAIPFLVILGKANHPEFSNPDATNVLINLNTLHVITHVLKPNSYLDLNKSDTDDIIALFNIIAEILERYKDILADKNTQIDILIEGIHELSTWIKGRNPHNDEFYPILKKVIRKTKKCTLTLKDMFTCVYYNTDYKELIPLAMQFYLDVQTVGIFECIAERYQEFATNEVQLIDAFRYLFQGHQNEAHTIYLEQSEKYTEQAQHLLNNGRVSIFCAAATKAAGVSALELAKGCKNARLTRYFQSFVVPQFPTVPFEFSNSIITILKMIINKTPNHELTQQLTTSLDSHTQDPLLKYLCGAAAYMQETELGYLSLIGALLPVPLQQKITHLDHITRTVSVGYIQTDTETRQYLVTLPNMEIPQHIADAYRSLPPIKTLYEAEQSFSVLIAMNQIAIDKGIADQTLTNLISNLVHLLGAWILSIAEALQAATITFVPNAIATIEKNSSIKQDVLNKIQIAYRNVCRITFSVTTPVVINNLITNVSKSMLETLPLVEDLIQHPSLTLSDTQRDFQTLLSFSEIAIRLFEQLKRSTLKIDFNSPVYTRHQVISLVNPIIWRLNQITTELENHPESVPSILAENRTNITAYLNALYNIDRSVDIKLLTEQFTRLSTTKDKAVITECVEIIIKILTMIKTQVSKSGISKEELQKIDINNNEQMYNLISMITNPLLQTASYDLLKVVDENSGTRDYPKNLRVLLRDTLLNVITLRINGYQQLDFNRLATISDNDLVKNRIAIYTSLPLYSSDHYHQVQEMALPLLTSTDPKVLRTALIQIINLLTVTLPIQEKLRPYAIKAAEDQNAEFTVDLDDLSKTLQLNVELPVTGNTRTDTLYDTAILYAYSCKQDFNDKTVARDANIILETDDANVVQEYAYRLATNLLLNCVISNHFSQTTLQSIKTLLIKTQEFKKNPTDANRRAVYGAALQLPTLLDSFGEMNKEFLDLVTLALQGNENISQSDAQSFYSLINPEMETFTEAIMAVPEPVAIVQKRNTTAKIRHIKPPPKIVRRVIKKTRPPPPIHVKKTIKHIVKIRKSKTNDRSVSFGGDSNLDSNTSSSQLNASGSSLPKSPSTPGDDGFDGTPAGLGSLPLSGSSPTKGSSGYSLKGKRDFMNSTTLRCIKLVESSRASRDIIQTIKQQIEDNDVSSIDALISEYNKISQFLSGLLSESHDAHYEALNKSVEELTRKLVSEVQSHDPDTDEIQECYEGMHRVYHDVLYLSLQDLGVTNTAQAELSLMASKVDQMARQLDDSVLVAEEDLDPLRRRVASSARVILQMTKNLGLEARAQTEFLQKTDNTVSDEKGLIKAAMQTSDAAQMFFLLLKLFAIKDPDIKYKVVAACKGMRVALTNIIVNLRAKGGSNEIGKRIENISEQIFEKLQYILELAEELINKESTIVKQATKKGVSKIVQKRNADSEVYKKRRALEEAENEIKRLNRAAAKIRGG